MLLTIDVGNTNIKVAVFKEVNLIEKFIFQKNELVINFEKILKKHSNSTNAVLSKVGKIENSDLEYLKSRINLIQIDENFQFPFENLYETPNTLGIDRMVLAAGGVLLYPNQNLLIIDAGTCITYDFVTSKNKYLGGGISPGLRLRYNSLHQFTSKLPLLDKKNPNNFIGKNTNDAIHSGVFLGLCHEIEGFISEYSFKNQQLTVILTGGDANFLANRLKSTIFADENFLLKSLQLLYTYNLQND